MVAAALVLLGYIFYENTIVASRVIDGTRYFWLDDDMMISMRYARNLAEGHGLVWNAGERVEGYTNFLWTVLMAGVHLTGVSDARAALLVKMLGFGFLGGSVILSCRLVRLFAPRSLLAVPVLLASMLMCPDVVLWSVWGFETSLLTFLNLVFLVRVLANGRDPIGYAALALIPLTRGDGVYLFAANALVAVALSQERRRTMAWLAAALVPALVHLAFRRAYYGEWFPNTYFLKVYGLDDVRRRGNLYARNWVLTYSILAALGAGSALGIMRRDARGVVFFSAVLSTLGYVVLAGGDMLSPFRFFAHVMPVVFVFAAAGVASVARGPLAAAVWCAVLLLTSVPLLDPLRRVIAVDSNGDPERQLRVAMILKRNALPTSSVVVLCAGVVPYFSRLRALDMVGKSDKHIARMLPYPGAMIGHGKVDPAYTLGQNPDLVVTCSWGRSAAIGLERGSRTTDPQHTFAASDAFQSRYLAYPVEDAFLLEQTAVYTHVESPEFPRRAWTGKIEWGP
jgi:arabinofuranosyltransferase